MAKRSKNRSKRWREKQRAKKAERWQRDDTAVSPGRLIMNSLSGVPLEYTNEQRRAAIRSAGQ